MYDFTVSAVKRRQISLETTEAPYAWSTGTLALVILSIVGLTILVLDINFYLKAIQHNLVAIRKGSSVSPENVCTGTGHGEFQSGEDPCTSAGRGNTEECQIGELLEDLDDM